MPRPSFATVAVLFLAGVVMAPAVLAQYGPQGGGGGGQSGGGGGRAHRPGSEGRGQSRAPTSAPPVSPEQQQAAAAAVAQAESSSTLLDKIVAVVNDGIVTESELDTEIAVYEADQKQQGKTPPPVAQLRGPMLEYLISRELQLQRADRLHITVSDEQLNATLSNIAKRSNLTLSQLPDALAPPMDYAWLREDTRKKILLQMVRDKEVKVNITPRELDQYIERMKKTPGENDEYDVSDILLASPSRDATQAQVEELGKKAQDVYEKAVGGDFGQVAVTYSNAPTALQGGELGWRKGSNLPSDLAEAIVALKPGEVSRPFFTPNGFHIVKLNGIRLATGDPVQDQVHLRHILIKPDTLHDDATVQLNLAGVRQRILKGEDFAVFASSMSQDSASAVNGGDLDWRSPDEFDPAFAAAISKLKDNEISEPFKSQFGWHIVQLLGRRKFDTTEDALRDRAFRQLRDSKTDEETESWLREMRDEAYIDTKL